MAEIEFDPVKDQENRQKHGLPLALAPLIFEGPFVEEEDRRTDYGETRIVATGPIEQLGGRICVVVYVWRSGVRRIISFRKANEREARKYRASVA